MSQKSWWLGAEERKTGRDSSKNTLLGCCFLSISTGHARDRVGELRVQARPVFAFPCSGRDPRFTGRFHHADRVVLLTRHTGTNSDWQQRQTPAMGALRSLSVPSAPAPLPRDAGSTAIPSTSPTPSLSPCPANLPETHTLCAAPRNLGCTSLCSPPRPPPRHLQQLKASEKLGSDCWSSSSECHPHGDATKVTLAGHALGPGEKRVQNGE